MRDPRVDPRPGDVLFAKGGRARTVEAVSGGEVFYRCRNEAFKSVALSRWKRWAAASVSAWKAASP